MSKAKAAAIQLLEAKKIPFEILRHKTTFTAADEANTLHVSGAKVLKTVVLDTGAGHVIAVTPASRKLDIGLVREALADTHAHLAGEIETARDFPAFELGSMPPLPSLTKVPVFVDPEIMQHKEVIFAADHEESVKAKTEDLFGGEYVTVTPLVRHFTEVPTDH
ncbi:MAG TPA: YbaK/EbsC family protein [Candidatus Udaeobacter sp.]|nr:YbaK/EbsC family protein [Candidatus Udaeobacter sp.]